MHDPENFRPAPYRAGRRITVSSSVHSSQQSVQATQVDALPPFDGQRQRQLGLAVQRPSRCRPGNSIVASPASTGLPRLPSMLRQVKQRWCASIVLHDSVESAKGYVTESCCNPVGRFSGGDDLMGVDLRKPC